MQEPKDAYAQRQAAGARTPDELATRLEDAFIVRDPGALAELFDEHAILSPRDPDMEVRGSEEIASFAAAHWQANRRYLAQVRHVVQASDTAVVVVDWSLTGRGSSDGTGERGRGVDVLRRGSDGTWRYLISLLHVSERSKGEQRWPRWP
jgi:ketosteroid isomerase-like protein